MFGQVTGVGRAGVRTVGEHAVRRRASPSCMEAQVEGTSNTSSGEGDHEVVPGPRDRVQEAFRARYEPSQGVNASLLLLTVW